MRTQNGIRTKTGRGGPNRKKFRIAFQTTEGTEPVCERAQDTMPIENDCIPVTRIRGYARERGHSGQLLHCDFRSPLSSGRKCKMSLKITTSHHSPFLNQLHHFKPWAVFAQAYVEPSYFKPCRQAGKDRLRRSGRCSFSLGPFCRRSVAASKRVDFREPYKVCEHVKGFSNICLPLSG